MQQQQVKKLPSEKPSRIKIAVLGAGAFGTSMATICARNGHDVVLYARSQKQVDSINTAHCNPNYLSDFTLLPNIVATTSIEKALMDVTLILHCLPAQMTPNFLKCHRDVIPPHAILVSTSKGLYLETKELLSDAMLRALGRDQPLAFLSGPSFAIELMKNTPSMVVVASTKLFNAVKVQRALSSTSFRIYSSQDIVGVQLGGALKNPLAIGAGMIEGSGFGINTLAAFVTRSSLELKQLCIAMGGEKETISGLAGIGDLMLTAFGNLSRNRNCGLRLIKGDKLEDILKDYTVEGVPTAEVAVIFADACGLDLPIFRAVNELLKGQITSKELQNLLMNRPLRGE